MVSVQNVRDGLIAALKALYPDTKVYDEEIQQGLKEPCFFVKTILIQQQHEMNKRYRRSHSFDVHFFASTNEERHAVAECLLDGLRSIQVNGIPCRGSGLQYEIVERVMHFFVDYNFHVIASAPDGIKMQNLNKEVTASE